MKSKVITCGTFRAVFETGISDQGQLNTFHHEEKCVACREWAEDQRVQTITCEHFQHLVTIPFSTPVSKVLRKHARDCFSLKCYDNPTYERRMLQLLLEGCFRWIPECGGKVRITDGPFVNFTGTIIKIDTEDFFIAVQTNVFGRKTDIVVKPSFIEHYQGESE